MSKSYTDPSANTVLADPPRSVGKITISKGGNTGEEQMNPTYGVMFKLKFEGVIPVIPNPVSGNLEQWVLTALGIESGYPVQDNYTVMLASTPLPAPGEYSFEGRIAFDPGAGTGDGVMYNAKIKIENLPISNATNVDIVSL